MPDKPPPDPPSKQTVSHFRIMEALGAGGMGQVYKAEDTKLRRTVALKFVSGALLENPEARSRLLREARSAATLNHPNICTIYEVGEVQPGEDLQLDTGEKLPPGTPFIAMELIEGKPLDRVLSKSGPLPLDEFLDMAVQMAQGLAEAHTHGIVHRDLKPQNVVVTLNGLVKILDFGLAKPVTSEGPVGAETITAPLTHEGSLLGTTSYMSPEQARGQPVDSRSDLFSLGITLYEMVTGELPFHGSTPLDTLTAITQSEPRPPSQLNSEVPPELERILSKCLRKLPEERYQDSRDLLVDLRHLKRETDSQSILAPDIRTVGLPNRFRRSLVLFGILAIAAIGIYAVRLGREAGVRDEVLPEISQLQLTTNTVENPVWVALISPDGRYLAYLDEAGLFIKVLETGELKEITPLQGTDDVYPGGWFPDGTRLVVTLGSDGPKPSLWTVSIVTGAMRKIRDNAIDAGPSTVSPDGKTIAYTPMDDGENEIWLMDADGSNSRLVVAMEENDSAVAWWVCWAPDSRRIAYRRQTRFPDGIKNAIESCDLSGNQRTVIVPPMLHLYPGIHAVWVPDGRIIFSRTESTGRLRDNNLWAVEVDTGSGEPRGEPKRLTSWVSYFSYSMSCTIEGEIALVRWRTQVETFLWTVISGEKRTHTVRQITRDAFDDWPGAWLGGEGGSLLITSNRRGTSDIFSVDVETGSTVPLVTGPEEDEVVGLSPDGNWLLYRVRPEPRSVASAGPWTLMRVSVDGGSPVEIQTLGGFDDIRCGRIAGARCVLSESSTDQTNLFEFDTVLGKGSMIAELGPAVRWWDLSPDGQHLAWLVSVEEEPAQLGFLDLESGARREVSVELDNTARPGSWSAEGDCLYTMTQRNPSLIRIELDGRVSVLGSEDGLAYGRVLPSPDGKSFAFAKSLRESSVWLLSDY